jgi:hypothetical protein
METKNVEKLQIVTNIFLILFCTLSMFVMTLAEIRRPSVTPTTGTTEVASATTGTTTPTPAAQPATNTQTGTQPAANTQSTNTQSGTNTQPAAETPSAPKTE